MLLRNLNAASLIEMLYRLPAILVALSFHECAHAYAALKRGDPTARNLGRLTLNPLQHIDPWGFLCLVLVGFGWAKPVPVNPRNFSNLRRDDTIVSLAGVAANFLLALLSTLLFFIYMTLNLNNAVIEKVLSYFISINLGLMVFNLVPLPPLDGSHVLENLLIKKTGPKPFLFLQQYGYIILMALLLTGILSGILGRVVSWILNGMISLFSMLFGMMG